MEKVYQSRVSKERKRKILASILSYAIIQISLFYFEPSILESNYKIYLLIILPTIPLIFSIILISELKEFFLFRNWLVCRIHKGRSVSVLEYYRYQEFQEIYESEDGLALLMKSGERIILNPKDIYFISEGDNKRVSWKVIKSTIENGIKSVSENSHFPKPAIPIKQFFWWKYSFALLLLLFLCFGLIIS